MDRAPSFHCRLGDQSVAAKVNFQSPLILEEDELLLRAVAPLHPDNPQHIFLPLRMKRLLYSDRRMNRKDRGVGAGGARSGSQGQHTARAGSPSGMNPPSEMRFGPIP
ncbi:MAG: hypothetical protein C4320_00710 [Armatimonadota bacterium]